MGPSPHLVRARVCTTHCGPRAHMHARARAWQEDKDAYGFELELQEFLTKLVASIDAKVADKRLAHAESSPPQSVDDVSGFVCLADTAAAALEEKRAEKHHVAWVGQHGHTIPAPVPDSGQRRLLGARLVALGRRRHSQRGGSRRAT